MNSTSIPNLLNFDSVRDAIINDNSVIYIPAIIMDKNGNHVLLVDKNNNPVFYLDENGKPYISYHKNSSPYLDLDTNK